VGLEGSGSASVQHLRAYRYRPAKRQGSIDIVQNLSTVDIFLDASSSLPLALRFNTHPDDDDMTNILVEIIFSNYQSFNGVQVPMHVQKLIFGALALDLTFNRATVNTGITDGPFTIQ
jgi:hypothetical protein